MSKAILIMDMPESCIECCCCYKAETLAMGEYTYKQLYRCSMQPNDEEIEDVYLSDILLEKPYWCPLKEIPNGIDCYVPDGVDYLSYHRGWYDCKEKFTSRY